MKMAISKMAISKSAICGDLKRLNGLLTKYNMLTVEESLKPKEYIDVSMITSIYNVESFGENIFKLYQKFLIIKGTTILEHGFESAIFEWVSAYAFAYQEIWSNFTNAHPNVASGIHKNNPIGNIQKELDVELTSRNMITTGDILYKLQGAQFFTHKGVNNECRFLQWFVMRYKETDRLAYRMISNKDPVDNDMLEWTLGINEVYGKVASGKRLTLMSEEISKTELEQCPTL